MWTLDTLKKSKFILHNPSIEYFCRWNMEHSLHSFNELQLRKVGWICSWNSGWRFKKVRVWCNFWRHNFSNIHWIVNTIYSPNLNLILKYEVFTNMPQDPSMEIESFTSTLSLSTLPVNSWPHTIGPIMLNVKPWSIWIYTLSMKCD